MWFGLEMALMGMVTVFTFLVILITFTILMSKLLGYFDNASVKENEASLIQINEADSNPLNEKLLKRIITAAIQQHRSAQNNYD